VKVKDILKQLEGMDPETELTIVPQQSYVLTPVVNEDDMEKGSEE
jgi:hypothetical protein